MHSSLAAECDLCGHGLSRLEKKFFVSRPPVPKRGVRVRPRPLMLEISVNIGLLWALSRHRESPPPVHEKIRVCAASE